MCGYCDITSERQIPLVDIDLDFGFAGMARLAISIEDYQEETYMNLLLQSFGLRSKNIFHSLNLQY